MTLSILIKYRIFNAYAWHLNDSIFKLKRNAKSEFTYCIKFWKPGLRLAYFLLFVHNYRLQERIPPFWKHILDSNLARKNRNYNTVQGNFESVIAVWICIHFILCTYSARFSTKNSSLIWKLVVYRHSDLKV